MITDVDAIEAALANAGWRAGAEALVAGWLAHQKAELRWAEEWAPDDRCSHVLDRPSGERLVLEWTSGDTWELSIFWPEGWGREHVGVGWRESLEEVAEEIVRGEGPFGGPRYPAIPTCAVPCGRGRRLAGDVELRFELLRDEVAAYFFIARDGTLNNLWVVRINPDHLPAALDSLERTPRSAPALWVQTEGEWRPWRFTTWRPLLARAQIGAQELLLSCADASTAVILAHTDGRLDAAVKLEMRELPDFDASAWLARATPWPTSRRDLGSAQSGDRPASPTVVQAGGHPPAPPTPDTIDPRATSAPIADVGKDGIESAELASEPDEQPKPRFALAPGASSEEIQRHFMDVETAIPPRLTGTATAVELWHAIREAHKRGVLPITGNWVDLVSVLHHRGFLSHLPGDRASRAALSILAQLSPLVRRLHHPRWVLGSVI